MALDLFDLSKTECRFLCCCTPVRGLGRKVQTLRKQYPPANEADTAAEIAEDIATPSGGRLYAAAFLRRTGGGPSTRYTLQFLLRIRRAGDGARRRRGARSGPGGRQFLAFVDEVLPKRRQPRSVRICAELRYDLAQKRPVFNLPVQLVSERDKDKKLSGARLSGIELSFHGEDSPFDHFRIAVTEAPDRVWLWFGARERVSLGDDPVGVAYARAREIAALFLEEVKLR